MTGRELSQALFDNVLAKGRKVRKEDLAAYRQEAQDLKKTCDNIELEGLRERRDAFLKIQFGTCFCPKDDFHMLLREYPWRYIFTLNIDDLVEYIYSDCPKEQQPLVHVKQSSTLRSSASLELYKLHGSVSRPDLGYVFDSEEYRAYAASASWTLTTFGHQAMTNDVIFLGTEFQEEDMHLMLQQLAAMVEVVQPPHYFFVTPEIHDRRLSRKIQDSKNMHFIPWKTERFLRMVKAEIGDISEIRRKMRDYGMVFYDEQYPAGGQAGHAVYERAVSWGAAQASGLFQGRRYPPPGAGGKGKGAGGQGRASPGGCFRGRLCGQDLRGHPAWRGPDERRV